MNPVADTILIGVAATALIDLWAWVRRRVLGVALPDYGMVGRWLGHMPRGRFVHAAIRAAAPVRGEQVIGWAAHYLIGVAFAALLAALWGPAWFAHPRLGPALIVGVATVAAPYLLMQPGMGAGLAARRSPNPSSARLHSFITHALFGVGLYAMACALALLPTR